MTLASLKIPEDPQQLADWLEGLILSEDLSQAILEWETLAGAPSDSEPTTLAQLTGSQLLEIDSRGLKSLPEETLRRLMAHPEAVLQLQEHILAECPQYWQQRLDAAKQSTQDEAAWAAIESQLGPSENTPGSVQRQNRSRGLAWSGMGALLAVAACLMIGLWVIQPPARPTGWGFNEPGILETARSEDELLETLADAAHTWFNKRPDNREDLALRLKQFDAGCQKLLEAPLAPLSAEAHAKVDEACRQTREEIAGYLSELEKGRDPATIRDEADQTVTTFEETLRQLM